MLRILGLLSLGHLLFGRRRHRLRRGILLGALLGYLANKDFDTERVAKDVHKAARSVQRSARKAVSAAKQEIRKAEHDQRVNEIREKVDARRVAHEERMNALRAEIEAKKAARRAEAKRHEVYSLPVSGTREAEAIRELTEDLERNARTAAMAANVPTIEFPEEDEKYYSSRKYGYVQG